jgi:hypothetical protein
MGLRKAESLLSTQLRTGINVLNAFLFNARVSFVSASLCSYGRGQQIARIVLVFCPQYSGAQQKLTDELRHLPDLLRLMGAVDWHQEMTISVMKSRMLGQFRGARDTL